LVPEVGPGGERDLAARSHAGRREELRGSVGAGDGVRVPPRPRGVPADEVAEGCAVVVDGDARLGHGGDADADDVDVRPDLGDEPADRGEELAAPDGGGRGGACHGPDPAPDDLDDDGLDVGRPDVEPEAAHAASVPPAAAPPGRGRPRPVRAPYAGPVIELKSPAEVEAMRPAGRFVAEVVGAVSRHAAVGVNLLELDALAHDMI